MISSKSNPLIRQARSLRQTKGRRESGLFLVEGIHHVGEAIEAGWEIEEILYAPERLHSDFAKTLLARFPGRIESVADEPFRSAAGKENPQGIIAVVRQRRPRLQDLPAIRVAAAIVAPQDPGNVGTILRILDAVRADAAILLEGGVDPYHPTTIRASLGAIFWKPLVEATFRDFDAWRRNHGYQLVGTSAQAERDFRDFRPTEPWILLLGTEQGGLTTPQRAAADALVSLPMRGRASSLNLAVAAGILLYAYCQ